MSRGRTNIRGTSNEQQQNMDPSDALRPRCSPLSCLAHRAADAAEAAVSGPSLRSPPVRGGPLRKRSCKFAEARAMLLSEHRTHKKCRQYSFKNRIYDIYLQGGLFGRNKYSQGAFRLCFMSSP